jgi:hypothetical protein
MQHKCFRLVGVRNFSPLLVEGFKEVSRPGLEPQSSEGMPTRTRVDLRLQVEEKR